MKIKALGFPLTGDHDNCFGIVISDKEILGSHCSSNYSFLKSDLESKVDKEKYDFEFVDSIITPMSLFNVLNSFISYQKEVIKQLDEAAYDYSCGCIRGSLVDIAKKWADKSWNK